MRRLIPFLFCLLQSGSQSITITVQNQSFELGYGQSYSQDLGVTPKQLQEIPDRPGYYNEGVYVLQFSAVNILPAYPGYYTVEIDFGTQELCEASGWGIRTPAQITVVCPGAGYIVADHSLPSGGPVQGQSNLVLHASVPGWPLKFENVSLTFVPQN